MEYSAHTQQHTNKGRQYNGVATRADIQTHDTTQPEEGDNNNNSASDKLTSEHIRKYNIPKNTLTNHLLSHTDIKYL